MKRLSIMRAQSIGINVFPLRPGKNGGVETLVSDMVEGLCCEQSTSRFVLFASHENQNLFPDHHPQLRKMLLDIPVEKYKQYGCQFREKIESEVLDFVHYPLTTIFPLDLDVPCLLSVMDIQHEYLPEFFTQKEWQLRDATYRASIKRAQRIIAISNHTKKCLIDCYGINPDCIDVVYPWCGEAFYQQCRKAACDKTRKAFHLPERYIVYPAGTWPHKNHERLLHALADLKNKGLPIPLVLMGIKDKSEETILALVEDLDLRKQIHRLGFVERKWVKPLIAGAEFLVFPSLFEGFGIPVLEAMALGTPVACTRNTSLPEVAGEAAVFFDENDASSMSNAIEELWNDPHKRSKHGELGRQRARLFHKRRVIARLFSVYERMADHTSHPGKGCWK